MDLGAQKLPEILAIIDTIFLYSNYYKKYVEKTHIFSPASESPLPCNAHERGLAKAVRLYIMSLCKCVLSSPFCIGTGLEGILPKVVMTQQFPITVGLFALILRAMIPIKEIQYELFH